MASMVVKAQVMFPNGVSYFKVGSYSESCPFLMVRRPHSLSCACPDSPTQDIYTVYTAMGCLGRQQIKFHNGLYVK